MDSTRVGLLCLLVAASVSAGGCGLQDQVLGAKSGLLLQGFDTLAHPGKEVTLTARLQGGDYLRGLEGYLVGFYRLDHKLGDCRTDRDGFAEIPFVPEEPGNHVVLARLEDPDVRKYSLSAVEIVMAARPPEAKAAVVDMDRTVVGSGFGEVLSGGAEPMPDSRRVLRRLAEAHSIIYLTHRPDIFTTQSKRWLRKWNFPLGPLLTSSLSEFFGGSGAFKSAAIGELKKRFPHIEVGIGDKISDAQAYLDHGLETILILHPDRMETPEAVRRWIRGLKQLPDEAGVVTSWQEVEDILFRDARHPVSRVIVQLKELAKERAREALEPAGEAPASEQEGTP